MNIEVVDIQEGDVVLTALNVGNLPPNEVDPYVKKCLNGLKDVFGCKIAVVPVRDDTCNLFDFLIIRNASKKNKKSKKQ